MSSPAPDPVFKSARREAIVVLLIWASALVYTIGFCYQFGYHRPVEQIGFILGFPDWVFWGILAPWTICTLLSGWFAFGFMSDEDLGADGQTEDAAEETGEVQR
jgi:hypothetical protein